METKMNKRTDDRLLTEGLHPLDIDALVEARHPDPFSKLGLHQTDAGPVVHVLLPGATGVQVLERDSSKPLGTLTQVHPATAREPQGQHRSDAARASKTDRGGELRRARQYRADADLRSAACRLCAYSFSFPSEVSFSAASTGREPGAGGAPVSPSRRLASDARPRNGNPIQVGRLAAS